MTAPAAPAGSQPQEFLPYQVVDSGRSVESVFAQVNEAVWYGYGPDYRAGGPKKIVAGPEFDFVALLRELVEIPRVRFVSHWELLGTPCGPDEIRVAFRHDIDSDIVAALHQAEIQATFGVTANWVVLHTAPYYGAVDAESGTFVRNDSMIEVYKRFQELGHEVSLHSDPLGLYQFHGIDGAEGFLHELGWLRSHGIEIRGTTAHNHRPTYGAENYEIFTEYLAPAPNAQPLDATWVNHRGKGSPLRLLDAKALGLEYEGNQIFWREDMNIEYGSARFTNLWFWTDHRRKMNNDPQLLDREFLDQRRMLGEITSLRGGTDVVLVVHPEYFGARGGYDEAPVRALDRVLPTPLVTDGLGWQSYTPFSVVAESRHNGDDQVAQSFNVANELGMLDLPLADRPTTDRTILVVGADNVDGRRVAIPSQFPARIGLLGEDKLSQSIDFRKLAYPGMAIDRLWPWLRNSVAEHEPDTVVLGIAGNALDHFGMAQWYDKSAAAVLSGDYLVVDDVGVVHEHSWPAVQVQSVNDWSALLTTYRWVIDWLRAQEIRTVLLVESSAGAASDWADHPHRLALQALAATAGALLVDPIAQIDREQRRLDDLSELGEWNATAHRVASEELFAGLFPHATPAEFKTNFERRRETLDAVARLNPAASALGLPSASAIHDHKERREGALIKEYPTPFTSAISIVGDVDGSSTPFYNEYIGRLVGELGIDHGDSIHLASYHQRYSRGRIGLATKLRAVCSYDLRRDNAGIKGGHCWISHVLKEYHRGNIDHLHGLYAWGARTLPLIIEAAGTSGASGGSGGSTVLQSPFAVHGVPEGPREPFAYNAEWFPLISLAVETTATTVPGSIAIRYRDQSMKERMRPNAPNALQRRPPTMALASTRVLPSGNTLAMYTAESPVLDPVEPGGYNAVVPQVDIRGIDLDLPAESVVSAALHNTDPRGARRALAELRSRFNMSFELITAHGRYHFYSHEALGPNRDTLDNVLERRGREIPRALFGDPTGEGAANLAVADDPNSAAQVFPALYDEGIRYLVPCGMIGLTEAIFDPLDMTFPVVDRAGAGVQFMRRTLPNLSQPVTDERHGEYSRISTFENRLRHVLDLLDQGTTGMWPFYTHLGQTNDLEEPPEPWFSEGVVEELADRYYGCTTSGSAGGTASDGSETSENRPWVTRASVLANYATMLQYIPDLVNRRRNHIEISRRVDRLTGRQLPEHRMQLFGLSMEVTDPLKATVGFDGDELVEVVRWHDRNEITLVPCGIRWSIIGRTDPVEVAGHAGDIEATTTPAGSWSWEHEDRHDAVAPEPFGRLTLDESGSGRFGIELADLDVAAAQVAAFKLRKGHGVEAISVRLGTEGGAVYEIADTGGVPTEVGTGRFEIMARKGDWVDVFAPLWGFEWNGPMGDKRTIRTIEIVATGAPGATADVAGMYLGRPRVSPPDWETRGPLLGGDAAGHQQVNLRRLGSDDVWTCAVESDGLWVSPRLESGAWQVDADGVSPRVVQVLGDRFDIKFDFPPDFVPTS